VKLFAGGPDADSRLASLQAAAKLSHPSLLNIFATGRCEIEGEAFVYAVTEFAEENVAQVLPSRALTAEEVREMLPSILSALDYVHSQELVLADLKPANIMASSDQLKLASVGVTPIGAASTTARNLYRAPDQPLTAASDIWSLGMSLVEVLTQKLPDWDPSGTADAVPPTGLPAPFDEIARHSLVRDPKLRWSIADIRKSLATSVQAAAVPKPVAPPAPKPVQQPVTKPAAPKSGTTSRRPLTIGVLVALAIVATIAIPRLRRSPTAEIQAPEASQTSAQPQPQESQSPIPESANKPSAARAQDQSDEQQQAEEKSEVAKTEPPAPMTVKPAATSTVSKKISDWDERPKAVAQPVERQAESAVNNEGVVQQVVPDVPAKARNTIQGKVRVKVKVSVDSAGNVTAAEFVSPGPSKYFSKLAIEAARDWKFIPAQAASSRAWALQFEFRRAGTTAAPAAISR
jgi:TonB family protein